MRTAPGTAPGTLVADPDAARTEIRVIGYGEDTLEEKSITDARELAALRGRWPVLWVSVEGQGDVPTIETVGQIFGLHRLALEDVVNLGQRAKVEPYTDHLFVVANIATFAERLETEQISLVLGSGFVLTFHEKPSGCLDPVRERLRKGSPRIRSGGPGYLTYAILDTVVDGYFPALEAIGNQMDTVEEQIFEGPDGATISRIHDLKNDLVALKRAMWPHRDMLTTLMRDDSTHLFTEETRLYLRDVYDHSIRAIDLVESYRDVGSSLQDLYLSTVSNRMNEIMKVLTVIATIFIPLGFIAGLYGMNFDRSTSPWNMPELGWYWGYPASLALMALVAGGLLWYFGRKGWLR